MNYNTFSLTSALIQLGKQLGGIAGKDASLIFFSTKIVVMYFNCAMFHLFKSRKCKNKCISSNINFFFLSAAGRWAKKIISSNVNYILICLLAKGCYSCMTDNNWSNLKQHFQIIKYTFGCCVKRLRNSHPSRNVYKIYFPSKSLLCLSYLVYWMKQRYKPLD